MGIMPVVALVVAATNGGTAQSVKAAGPSRLRSRQVNRFDSDATDVARHRGPMMRPNSLEAAPAGRRSWSLAAAGVVATIAATGSFAAVAYHVTQRDRAFGQKEITVAIGDVIQFDNEDEFIHQIYIDGPNFSFDSEESYPGNSIDVTFTKGGTYFVRCHIHPKMALEVIVK
jgi:plastocyanin